MNERGRGLMTVMMAPMMMVGLRPFLDGAAPVFGILFHFQNNIKTIQRVKK